MEYNGKCKNCGASDCMITDNKVMCRNLSCVLWMLPVPIDATDKEVNSLIYEVLKRRAERRANSDEKMHGKRH